MVRVSKTLKFCAAHRLFKYRGACSNIHGHNYKVVVTIERKEWQDMVLDFSIIKKELQSWLDSEYDHAIILNVKDPLLTVIKEADSSFKVVCLSCNPTAEVMAIVFRDAFEIMLRDSYNDLNVHSVRVYETDTSYAEATKP